MLLPPLPPLSARSPKEEKKRRDLDPLLSARGQKGNNFYTQFRLGFELRRQPRVRLRPLEVSAGGQRRQHRSLSPFHRRALLQPELLEAQEDESPSPPILAQPPRRKPAQKLPSLHNTQENWASHTQEKFASRPATARSQHVDVLDELETCGCEQAIEDTLDAVVDAALARPLARDQLTDGGTYLMGDGMWRPRQDGSPSVEQSPFQVVPKTRKLAPLNELM